MAKGMIEIDSEHCKGCGYCKFFCPEGCIEMGDKVNSLGYFYAVFSSPEACTGCSLCGIMCPDLAIEVYRR